MNWIPLVDRVLIQKEGRERTDGGLFLPSTMNDNQGTVVAVGPGVYDSRTGNLVPTNVKPGDVVVLPEHGNVEEVELNGTKYVVCREIDLLLYKSNA